jgi:hypothetical protein
MPDSDQPVYSSALRLCARNFGEKCGAVVAGEVKVAAQGLDAVFEADQS